MAVVENIAEWYHSSCFHEYGRDILNIALARRSIKYSSASYTHRQYIGIILFGLLSPGHADAKAEKARHHGHEGERSQLSGALEHVSPLCYPANHADTMVLSLHLMMAQICASTPIIVDDAARQYCVFF